MILLAGIAGIAVTMLVLKGGTHHLMPTLRDRLSQVQLSVCTQLMAL